MKLLRPIFWLFAYALVGQAVAAAPTDRQTEADASTKTDPRKHWAFQPVRKPAIPAVKDSAWVHNPVDAFILSKLEARGWHPSPPAQPRALLRRLYLDLIGLPPTLAEQEGFLKEPSAAARSDSS